ncbi:hypothetical protein HGG75_04775 [Ochrobactrum pseudogrignonense]|nr:hypothetical protein [Brucella pseudogrignonensis]
MIAFFHDLQAGRVGRTLLSDSATPALLGVIVPVVSALVADTEQFAARLLISVSLTLAWQHVFTRVRGLRPGLDGIVAATLIALLVPADAPLWQLALGVSFGVVIAEQVFGGRGRNFVHPAVAALAFVMFSFTEIDYRAGPNIPLAALLPALVLLLLSGRRHGDCCLRPTARWPSWFGRREAIRRSTCFRVRSAARSSFWRQILYVPARQIQVVLHRAF